MDYLSRFKLVLESVDGRTLFEEYSNFNELCSNYLRREEWLVVAFPDAFGSDIKNGIIKYTTPFECNVRPVMRLIGIKKIKASDGNYKEYEYQIGAQILNFDRG